MSTLLKRREKDGAHCRIADGVEAEDNEDTTEEHEVPRHDEKHRRPGGVPLPYLLRLEPDGDEVLVEGQC